MGLSNVHTGYGSGDTPPPHLSDELAAQVDGKQGITAPIDEYDGRRVTNEEREHLDR